MAFHSFVFLLFLVTVLGAFYALPFVRAKQFLCFASLFFYSYWFPPFLLLLLTTALLDYWVAHHIYRKPVNRRGWVFFSIAVNLGFLFFFKYYNFFQSICSDVGAWIGASYSPSYLDIILPIGISFYTFESMSYLIDVYSGVIPPSKSVTDYILYIGFFPHLIAGPIVRARDFLPQLIERRSLSLMDWQFAVYRITRGFFLKVVIADNLSNITQSVFSKPANQLGGESWIGILSFSIQILGDFAGYSDIAIGCARLFGIHINENFNLPYLARGLTDFWSRWHISLTSWFRDYLYYPLAIRHPSRLYSLLFLVFVISGVWHGASWTFILWGALHGAILVIEKTLGRTGIFQPFLLTRIGKIISTVATWMILLFVWVPFRAPSVDYTVTYWKAMAFHPPSIHGGLMIQGGLTLLLFMMFYSLQGFKTRSASAGRFEYGETLCYLLLILIGPGPNADFIYFQF